MDVTVKGELHFSVDMGTKLVIKNLKKKYLFENFARFDRRYSRQHFKIKNKTRACVRKVRKRIYVS